MGWPATNARTKCSRHCATPKACRRALQHGGVPDHAERFSASARPYQRAREMFVNYGMTLLVTQSDYNIAYLYYLRGEYSRAIRNVARHAHRIGKERRRACARALLSRSLGDLSRTEYERRGEEIAHEGYLRFQKLGMGYEEAKCLANEAMAVESTGQGGSAHSSSSPKRAKFSFAKKISCGRRWWICTRQSSCSKRGAFSNRGASCQRAVAFFETSVLHGKAALCHLLLARIAVRTGELPLAHEECTRALERVAGVESPSLHYQAHFLLGQIQQASHDSSGATSLTRRHAGTRDASQQPPRRRNQDFIHEEPARSL